MGNKEPDTLAAYNKGYAEGHEFGFARAQRVVEEQFAESVEDCLEDRDLMASFFESRLSSPTYSAQYVDMFELLGWSLKKINGGKSEE